MCGIIGYVGSRPCRELLLAGLERLEYRGYDSAGIALRGPETGIEVIRSVGNLAALRSAIATRTASDDGATVATLAPPATSGIGHTRWATHGRVSEANAHPHGDTDGRVQIVLNGIVENYVELRERLTAAGAVFGSDTDAEVVAHLIAAHLDGDLAAAVRAAYAELRGHYAFVAIAVDEPDVLVGARKECPLIIGRGDGEQFVSSAITAFLRHTREIQLVEDGEIVTLRPDGVTFTDADGNPRRRDVTHVDWDEDTAEKGGYDTFMEKEIHEQPAAVAATLADRLHDGGVRLEDLGCTHAELRRLRRIVVVACGTSYHAGLIGRHVIEGWARVPVEVEVASEFRYRDPILGPDDLVIGITQSGETADTLAAMRLARRRGARVLAVTNVIGSQATRDADGTLFTRAGTEIGVAATKTFMTQVTALYLLALELATARDTLDAGERSRLAGELRGLPNLIAETIEGVEAAVAGAAERWHQAGFFLYLGRHAGLPVCLEGALKLKEITYIPTDAYAAGEMKHGPIALLDERTPVVCVATDGPVLDKLLSNMAEVHARGAHLITIATAGDGRVAEHSDTVIAIPRAHWLLQPLLAVVPLQLLAYRIAVARGLNVDQPRNLAKTVTVE